MTSPGKDAAFIAQLEHLTHIINDPSAIVYVRDTAGRYVWVSDSYGELLPFSREQVLGKTNRELYGEAAGTWEVADSFARASWDFLTTAEELFDTRTKKWRKFVSTKLIVKCLDILYLVGISVEINGPRAEAYERRLGKLRVRILEQMGAQPDVD